MIERRWNLGTVGNPVTLTASISQDGWADIDLSSPDHCKQAESTLYSWSSAENLRIEFLTSWSPDGSHMTRSAEVRLPRRSDARSRAERRGQARVGSAKLAARKPLTAPGR